MRGVCAWCGKDLPLSRPSDLPVTTHGICEDCFLDMRVGETLKRLQPGAGPYAIFVPPNRDDLVLRLWREGPPGCSFIVYTDRRQSERRGRRRPVPADRRAGRDRRSGNLSFLPPRLPDPHLPFYRHPGAPGANA